MVEMEHWCWIQVLLVNLTQNCNHFGDPIKQFANTPIVAVLARALFGEHMPWLALVARTAHHTRDTAALTRPRLALVGLAAVQVAVAWQALAILLAWVPVVSVGTSVTTGASITLLTFTDKPSTCLSVARLGKILTRGGTLARLAGLAIHGVSEESWCTYVAPGSSSVLATILAEA